MVITALPGLTRLAARAWVRGVRTSVHVGVRLAKAAVDPRTAPKLVEELSTEVRGYARASLGIDDLDQRVKQLTPGSASHPPRAGATGAARVRKARRGSAAPPEPELSLRAQGAALLRQSADVTDEERIHPAYRRILQELAPDEARILRLLAVEGPQPAVDVASANLIGGASETVEQGLNMIGRQAGVRRDDRMSAYLSNLERLSLIEFSEEPIDEPSIYQVLEAQPHVMDAIERANRAKTLHRSLRLSTFGKAFCDTCLPLDMDEIEALTDSPS